MNTTKQEINLAMVKFATALNRSGNTDHAIKRALDNCKIIRAREVSKHELERKLMIISHSGALKIAHK